MSTLYFKRFLGYMWRLMGSSPTRRIILFYHAVGNGPNAIPKPLFESQMKWLSKHADVLTLDDLLDGKGNKSIRVSIGFDDGYASVVDQAEPILSELNMVATVYVNTGWIDDSNRHASDPVLGHYSGEQFMTWRDAKVLVQRGWTVGSHGVEHLDLSVVNTAILNKELADSKRAIEMKLGSSCQHFAYTWGRFNKDVQCAVTKAGYLTAASALHGPIISQDNLFSLPRIDIQKIYTIDDFQAIVRGQWDYLGAIQKLKRLIYRR